MRLSPDQLILWQHGFVRLNATIVTTWALMLFLAAGAKLITRKLGAEVRISRWQCVLEILVIGIVKQIADVGLRAPRKYIGFIGTLFLFVAMANVFTIVPGYEPPTGIIVDHHSARVVRIHRCTTLRDPAARLAGLPEILSTAHHAHVAL